MVDGRRQTKMGIVGARRLQRSFLRRLEGMELMCVV